MAWRASGSDEGSLRLRDVTQADLPIFFDHQRDPVANRMAAFPPRDRASFMAHWAKIMADDTATTKTIEFNGDVVGNVVSFERSGVREVGYWIGRRFWGKGIATEALSAFLAQEGARPLYAHVAKANVASLRVLQKCGFTTLTEGLMTSDGHADEVEELLLVLAD